VNTIQVTSGAKVEIINLKIFGGNGPKGVVWNLGTLILDDVIIAGDGSFGTVFSNDGELDLKTGSSIWKTPPTTGTVSDIDNNIYNTVKIGSQWWMSDNLRTTRYNDGTSIPKVINDLIWQGLTTPAYCWYNNDSTNHPIYGAMYNFFTGADSNSHNVCPVGWHVPTVADWDTLTTFLENNGYGYQGSGVDIAKSMAVTLGWALSGTPGHVGNNQGDNNLSGFTGTPGGLRNNIGFINRNNLGLWWSSEDGSAGASNRNLVYNSDEVGESFNAVRWVGLSIRCLKD
ncbi:MAG: hypothetical protein HKN76_03135, partial [Saprospiraceae bacterium]|nr:hypothetical protein [Saprospiraceae bacterium]